MDFQSKSDAVKAALREAIITGELKAGTPLRQREIAAMLGVSPTPVREALRRLEAEGLVDYDLHRGATVVEGNFGPSEENFEIRAALEALAARLAAARVSEEDLAELQSLHDELAARRQTDDDVGELNRQFHFRIYEASQSAMLLALLRLLWQSLPTGPQVVRPLKNSVAQHAGILEALRSGDADLAERLTREHILGARGQADPESPKSEAKKPRRKPQRAAARSKADA